MNCGVRSLPSATPQRIKAAFTLYMQYPVIRTNLYILVPQEKCRAQVPILHGKRAGYGAELQKGISSMTPDAHLGARKWSRKG
jgi:hypothetical protein